MKNKSMPIFICLLFISFMQIANAALYELDVESEGMQMIDVNNQFWGETNDLFIQGSVNQVGYQYIADAVTYLKRNNLNAANKALKEAKSAFLSEFDKKLNIDSCNGLVKIALLEGDFQDAHKWLTQALEIDSDNIDTLYLNAKLLMMQSHYSDSKVILQKIIQRNNNYKFAYLSLAEIEIINKQYRVAEQHFKRVLLLDKKHLGTINNLAALYKVQGRNDEAIETLLQGYHIFQTDLAQGFISQRFYQTYMLNLAGLKKLYNLARIFSRGILIIMVC